MSFRETIKADPLNAIFVAIGLGGCLLVAGVVLFG